MRAKGWSAHVFGTSDMVWIDCQTLGCSPRWVMKGRWLNSKGSKSWQAWQSNTRAFCYLCSDSMLLSNQWGWTSWWYEHGVDKQVFGRKPHTILHSFTSRPSAACAGWIGPTLIKFSSYRLSQDSKRTAESGTPRGKAGVASHQSLFLWRTIYCKDSRDLECWMTVSGLKYIFLFVMQPTLGCQES